MKIAIILGFICLASICTADEKPKYGKFTVPLSLDHSYFQSNKALDFWALIPFYVPQVTGSSCSVGTAVPIVNAFRMQVGNLKSDEKLSTHETLLEKSGNSDWKRAVGNRGGGVTLDELSVYFVSALKAYGIENISTRVEHLLLSDKAAEEKKFREVLKQNEKSNKDFVIINFDQGVFTEDETVGHIAPIGAYDAKKDRVLILDPDREWYEPYWSPLSKVVEAMRTQDPTSKKARGFMIISHRP